MYIKNVHDAYVRCLSTYICNDTVNIKVLLTLFNTFAVHVPLTNYCHADDVDDGEGLPVQLPPTDEERATMCRCKPPPVRPDLNFTVMFNDSSYSGAEECGVIAVTVVATGVSAQPYTVTITLSEQVPVSARELFDFSNDTIEVTFNPGETEKTVLIVINPDCIREGSEFFDLTLSLDPAAIDLGISLGDPSVAVAEIEDTDSKQMTSYFVINNVIYV